jgi:hypothetical protein
MSMDPLCVYHMGEILLLVHHEMEYYRKEANIAV